MNRCAAPQKYSRYNYSLENLCKSYTNCGMQQLYVMSVVGIASSSHFYNQILFKTRLLVQQYSMSNQEQILLFSTSTTANVTSKHNTLSYAGTIISLQCASQCKCVRGDAETLCKELIMAFSIKFFYQPTDYDRIYKEYIAGYYFQP